jgi:iron complex outermembrane receptor protein
LLAAAYSAFAQTAPDFSDLSLEELANIKITSFTKKQQPLSQVAGAVYVITQEQIARSGLTSVPELLRLAPGIDVARVNGSQWSISARGPTGIYANKLLVLIDGRSIYSPVFSGVYWDLGMPLLDDIERIEVIRGPGATVWGANAVLGVINIITKSSQDTHGTTVTSGVGTSERALGSARVGGAIGSTSYRGSFGGPDNATQSLANGAAANDGWSSVQGGFRLDGADKQDSWMLEGDLFRGAESETKVNISLATFSAALVPFSFDTAAGNLNGEWCRRLGNAPAGGELRVASYYDYADRPGPSAVKLETRTWNTEVRYDFKPGRIHNLSTGVGERMISGSFTPQAGTVFARDAVTYNNLDAFAQDEMHFLRDTLLFTVGAKLERNHFTVWASEPSANLLWMPGKNHSLWISAARALRTPTLWETGVSAVFSVAPPSTATKGLPLVTYLDGSLGFLNESVKDFEAGYRAQLSKSFSADVTAFYDQYSDIRSLVGSTPTLALSPAPHLNLVGTVGNDAAEVGKGAEASIAWQTMSAWKLEGSYTYNIVNSWLTASAPAGSVDGAGNPPSRNKWRLQSYVNLSKSWQLDTFLYWSSAGSPINDFGPNVPVPAYTRLDIHLGYKASSHWQLSLAGQNLLQARHLEGLPELLTTYSYVDRGVYLKSTWQF